MQSLQHSCLRVTMLLQGHLGPADKVPEAQAAQARAHRPAQHCFEAVQEHSQVRGGGLTGVREEYQSISVTHHILFLLDSRALCHNQECILLHWLLLSISPVLCISHIHIPCFT